jgi:hypothetical protein
VEARLQVDYVASLWRLHGDEAEDGWVDATGCVRPIYRKIAVFIVLGPRAVWSFSLLLGPINRTLGGWGSLPLLLASFPFPRLERVSQELDFYSNNQNREGGRRPLCFRVVIMFCFNKKLFFAYQLCCFHFSSLVTTGSGRPHSG